MTAPRAAAWARAHPDVVEGGAGLLAGTAVLALSLLQWGTTDGGWTRGVTLGLALGLVVSYSVRRERRQRESRERAAADLRLQLARDLHDAVASQVALIGVQAAAARRVLAFAARACWGGARGDRGRGANGQRRFARDARGPSGGFVSVCRQVRIGGRASPRLAAPASRPDGERPGPRCHPGAAPALDAAAYRIVQESLANALAHAGAVRHRSHSSEAEGVLRIRSATKPARRPRPCGTGFGLAGMRERASGSAATRSLAAAGRDVRGRGHDAGFELVTRSASSWSTTRRWSARACA